MGIMISDFFIGAGREQTVKRNYEMLESPATVNYPLCVLLLWFSDYVLLCRLIQTQNLAQKFSKSPSRFLSLGITFSFLSEF